MIELNAISKSNGIYKSAYDFCKFAISSTLIALKEPTDIVFATSTPLTASIPGIAARWLRRKILFLRCVIFGRNYEGNGSN